MKQEIISKALSKIHSHRNKAEAEYQEKIRPLLEDEQYVALSKKLTRLQIEKARQEAYREENRDCHVEQGAPATPSKHLQTSCHLERSGAESRDPVSEANALNKNSLSSQITTLQSQLNAIKAKHNLQNIAPAYSCKLCNDEGYKNGQMCICLKQELSRELLAGSGFEKLEDFSSSIKTAHSLAPVFQKMQEWCQSNFKKTLVYLAGPTGVGKTHLIRCMANELIQKGKIVKIVTAFCLNQDFKDFSKTYNDELLKKYTTCEVLFIDDLGTEPLYRNVTLEYLYLVINERKMKCLPTVITSNLDMSDLCDRYDERIYSRIADRETSITLYLGGDDKRLSKK